MATSAAELFASLLGGAGSKSGSYNDIIAQNDPYSQYGDAIGAFGYTPYKRGDENTAIGIALGQALVKGLLKGAGQRYAANQRRGLFSLIPQSTDPAALVKPEGLDQDVFDAFRLQAQSDKLTRDLKRADAIDAAQLDSVKETRPFRQEAMSKYADVLNMEQGPDGKYSALLPTPSTSQPGAVSDSREARIAALEQNGYLRSEAIDLVDKEYSRTQDTQDRQDDLIKEAYDRVMKSPEGAAFSEIKTNYQNIRDLVKRDDRAASIGIIYNLAKIYDPGGRVTDGDYELNAKAQSALDQAYGNWRALVTGDGVLQPAAKQNILEIATTATNNAGKAFQDVRTLQYDTYGKRGIDTSLIGAPEFSTFEPFTVPGFQAAPKSESSLLEQARSSTGFSDDELLAQLKILKRLKAGSNNGS